MATVTAGGLHHGLVTPNGVVDTAAPPLVIPYRKDSATRTSAGQTAPPVAVDDCHFRMLKARGRSGSPTATS